MVGSRKVESFDKWLNADGRFRIELAKMEIKEEPVIRREFALQSVQTLGHHHAHDGHFPSVLGRMQMSDLGWEADVGGVSLNSMSQVSDMQPEFIIDGRRITSLTIFLDEFFRVVLPERPPRWNDSLDAFNDILRGGFGTPDGGFTLRWTHSAISRENLGYPETAREYEKMLKTCHPDNVPAVWRDLYDAQSGIGETVFDWILEIVRDHGPGGEESDDNVHLVLE